MLELNMNSSAEQHDKTSARGEISKLFVVDNAVPMYVQGGKKKNQQCHANRSMLYVETGRSKYL